jgi:exodeoxyribonuclease V
MISDHIEKTILNKLVDTPTNDQLKLIRLLAEFIIKSSDDSIFLISGYAGTGKTTVVSALINALETFKIKTVLLAPTGRAAKVLNSFSGKPAYTIHKKIYRQKSSKDGFGKFVLGKNLGSGTFFVVDEASMIGNQKAETFMFGSGNLLEDLLEFVYTGKRCKLILVGDSAQLPPVSTNESPALSTRVLEEMGFTVSTFCLKEVVRQAELSGILINATSVRQSIAGNQIAIPKIKTQSFTDIIQLNGSELISELTDCYEKYGIEDTIVVTRSNKRANIYNTGIRKSVLFNEEQIAPDDYMMVVKNNYYWLANDGEEVNFIANGDIIKILKIGKFEERYGLHFVNARIQLLDIENRVIETKLLLDTIDKEAASLTSDENKNFYYSVYEDFKHIMPKKKGYEGVRSDPYFNALQVKFAYAVTCHKAQGGQWKAVFIDQGYYTQDMLSIEYLRWLYTAFTRASEKLYLVNFIKDFFNE